MVVEQVESCAGWDCVTSCNFIHKPLTRDLRKHDQYYVVLCNNKGQPSSVLSQWRRDTHGIHRVCSKVFIWTVDI